MNQERKIKFKKSTNDTSNRNAHEWDSQQRQEVINKLMEEYNISSNKADEVVKKIEKMEYSEKLKKEKDFPKQLPEKSFDHTLNNDIYQVSNSSNKLALNNTLYDERTVKEEVLEFVDEDVVEGDLVSSDGEGSDVEEVLEFVDEDVVEGDLVSSDGEGSDVEEVLEFVDEDVVEGDLVSSDGEEHFQQSKDVDLIISNIIPDYNTNLSIELKNVDLTFEVSNEKVDTLKESFIRHIKGDKTKKIKIHALKDISFKVYKGEKIGIIGYNGAGKSTLLNVICGIYPPDKGTVETHGNISPLLSLGAGFDFNYSGRKNIILNGAVLGYEKEFIDEKIDEIIEFSELGEFIDIPIKNYSSGMLAKLGFSIATAVEPDILIVDEILGVGDVTFQKKSTDKIRSLMDGGTTVLFVSHSIPQIRTICDKAIWIDQGYVKEIGEVNKVCDHYLKDAEKASNEQLANIQFR